MTTEIEKIENLQAAYDGAYYTICGAGGELSEWVNGYQDELTDTEIGTPTKWLQTTGAEVNKFAGDTKDPFNDDLVILMFPLDGMVLGALAMFRLRMQDRWFNDIIDNM